MRDLLHSFTKLEFDKIKLAIQKYSFSEIGREHIQALNPSASIEEIKHNLSLVSEMKLLSENDEPLPLDSFADVRESLARSSIENYILPSVELHAIAFIVETGLKLQSYFTKREHLYPLLSDKLSLIKANKILAYNIKQAIDKEGNVKDSASKELQSLRRQIIDKSEFLRRQLESILKTVSDKEWVQDQIITARDGRMVIPIKTEHKNQIPGFIHSSSASGATVFIEPTETLELNNDIRTLQFREQREIEKILKELTRQVYADKDSLNLILDMLGQFDFIQAKAKYSIEILGNQPEIKSTGKLKLVNACHPILLQRHKHNEVVPLQLEMGNEIRTLVITGPNAGGKSVVMKTVGLLTMLAQSGCHISADHESEIRIFSDIFVDMGDEQSIENDLSSFSSHLQNLKFILENAGSSSLVLIDEIGSGTDPKEGASIAAAILQKLTQMDCTTIATTHHGELKAFAFSTPYFQNGAMEFNQDSFQPTYKFMAGIPGSSYAIEMAERMKFPADVLEVSRNLRGEKENKLERIILDLERQSLEVKNNLTALQEDRQTVNRSIEEYENKVSAFKKEVKSLKAKAVDEAKVIIQNAQATIENAIREIREKSASQESIKLSKKNVDVLTKEIQQQYSELSDKPKIIKTVYQIGDPVRFAETGARGEILSKVDENTYIVLIGDLKVKSKVTGLEPAEHVVLSTTQNYHLMPTVSFKQELDLRGMLGEEAIATVDKFLDSSILTGIHRVDIIHGKGTGALRKKITEYLKDNPNVKSFRLGEWNEGGGGVTVVELA